jgi:hypothetical protein
VRDAEIDEPRLLVPRDDVDRKAERALACGRNSPMRARDAERVGRHGAHGRRMQPAQPLAEAREARERARAASAP